MTERTFAEEARDLLAGCPLMGHPAFVRIPDAVDALAPLAKRDEEQRAEIARLRACEERLQCYQRIYPGPLKDLGSIDFDDDWEDDAPMQLRKVGTLKGGLTPDAPEDDWGELDPWAMLEGRIAELKKTAHAEWLRHDDRLEALEKEALSRFKAAKVLEGRVAALETNAQATTLTLTGMAVRVGWLGTHVHDYRDTTGNPYDTDDETGGPRQPWETK